MELDLGTVRVDLDARWVDRDGAREHLTTREAELLRFLHLAGRPVSRDEILAEVWGYGPQVVSRTCDTTVRRLRTKIEDDPADPTLLVTVHGLGYRLISAREEPGPAPTPAPAPASAPTPSRRRYPLGDRILDLDRLSVEGPDGSAALTATESVLLDVLVEADGAVIERDTLQRRVWGTSLGRPLGNSVARLRRKLEDDPTRPRFLLTTARGYRLDLGSTEPTETETALPPVPGEVDRRFGRDAEIRAVQERFDAGDRLVTLTGPGGVGKTRLALAVARSWEAAGQKVVWVDASEVGTVGVLVAAVAAGLRVHLAGGAEIEVVIRALSDSAPVLVLDNLEQVAGAAGPVGALLVGVPSLRILATSRVSLHVRGERPVQVEPLPVHAAVELFLDRSPRTPTEAEHDDVAALVADLDGLPLAIELAAARTRVLPVSRIRELTRDALRLLSDGPSGGRYQSIRASLDGSYELLTPAARAAIAQLGVFEGSFAVDDALAVVDLAPDVWPIDVLQDLVDASLVRHDVTERRFSLLLVVREYARERLTPADRAAAEVRHGRRYAALLPTDEPAANLRRGPRSPEIAYRISLELPNVRVALERARARGDAEVAVGAVQAAWWVWSAHGPMETARDAIVAVLDLPLEPGDRAGMELLAGNTYADLGAVADAERHLLNARAIAASTGDLVIEAEAVGGLTRAYLNGGRVDLGRPLAREGLELARRTGLWSLECSAILKFAFAVDLDRPEEASDALARGVQLAEAQGATDLLSRLSFRQGMLAYQCGRLDEAEARFRRSLGLCGEDAAVGDTLYYQALMCLYLRREGQALDLGLAAVRILRRTGHRNKEAHAHQLLGLVYRRAGRLDEAEAAMRRAIALSRATGDVLGELATMNELAGQLAQRPDAGTVELEQALAVILEAVEVAKALGDPLRDSVLHVNLARLSFLLDLDDAGRAAVGTAVACADQVGSDPQWATAKLELATALADRDRVDEALEHATLALERGVRTGHEHVIEDATLVIIGLDARRGKGTEAAERFEAVANGPRADEARTQAGFWLAAAEVAQARGDADGLREALAAAARISSPAFLGRRFRALFRESTG